MGPQSHIYGSERLGGKERVGEKKKKKKEGLVHGHHVAVGQQRELCIQHSGCETAHDRLGLNMEVPKHLVRSPAADKTDDVGVNLGAKECHGASSTKRAGTDVGREEAELGGIAGRDGGT